MLQFPKHRTFVAIDPTRTGFAFAVLEAPHELVDYGQRMAARGTRDLGQKVAALLGAHHPATLVVEDVAATGALRRTRARREICSLERLATKHGLMVARVPRFAVLETFAPGKGKYEVALRLAELFPELTSRLPKKRKVWMPEDPRMNVFDAVALAAAEVEQSGKGAFGGAPIREAA